MDAASQLAQLSRRVFEVAEGCVEELVRLTRVVVEACACHPEIEGQLDEPLLRSVVKVALQAAPRRVGRLDDPRPRGLQLGLGGLAVADVAEVAGERRRTGHLDAGDGELERKHRAVGTNAGDLHPLVQHRGLLGREVTREAAAVAFAKLGRDDERGHFPAHHVDRAIAEGALGRRVEIDDTALVVHGHDAVEGGIEHRTMTRLLRAQRLRVAASLHRLADQIAERDHGGEKLGVELARFTRVELDDPEHAPGAAVREAERRVEAGPARGRRAREVLIGRDVGNPGGLTAAPHPPGQPLARRQHRVRAGGLELLGVGADRVPGLHATERLRLVGRRLPHRPQPPLEALTYRPQRSGQRVARLESLREAASHGMLRPGKAGHAPIIPRLVFRHQNGAVLPSAMCAGQRFT